MKNTTILYIVKIGFLSLILLNTTLYTLFSQEAYTLQIQNEKIAVLENINSFKWTDLPDSAISNHGYYVWIQFFETPKQRIQDKFSNDDYQFLDYIGNKTYLTFLSNKASIDFLKVNGVRAIFPVESRFKLSEQLKNPPYPFYAIDGNSILVTLQYYKEVDSVFLIKELTSRQIQIKRQYKNSQNIELAIPNNCLEDLASVPYVKWIELIASPSVANDLKGKGLHKSNGLDTQTNSGRNYTGEGITILVRDDGIIGPHIDFQGRIDNSNANGTGQNHGDGVAGIFAGSGNLNPIMRGMAAGAFVFSVNHLGTFLDVETQTLVNNGTVQVTNTSYGQICSLDGYNTVAETIDELSINVPNALHVFSAGNNNNAACSGTNDNQWRNVNGGHTQGKNIISVANVDYEGDLLFDSSRGPAYDGRIKPEISANGYQHNSTSENNMYQVFGGTSAAAPGVAGVAAQLYQVYADANGGAFPKNSLIKATLLNTANDIGNIGPDFKHGWGIVNALRAGILLEENRFLFSTISQSGSNNHSINVPTGTKQVRFMLYWNDPAATPGTTPALVNDLDFVVTDPSSAQHLPWILDNTLDPILLNLPATHGEDHLNNMEQVLINNPTSGNYSLNVSGFNVPVGPQEYVIVYELISENLTLTYPNMEETFVPGVQEVIQWDAVNTTNSFVLEYSTNNGGSWNSITTVPNDRKNFAWTVPSNITGNALVRVTSGAFQDVSDEVFSIANLVSNIQITQVCENDATFAWNGVANTEIYDVYLLGDTYMEVVSSTPNTSISLPIIDPFDELWVAVVAKNNTQGWKSRRSIAVNHPGGYVNCLFPNDLSVEEILNDQYDFSVACTNVSSITVAAVIENKGSNSQTNFPVSYQFNSEPQVNETFTGTLIPGEQQVYEFSTPLLVSDPGDISLTVSTNLPTDLDTSNDEIIVNYFAQIDPILPFLIEEMDCIGGTFPPLSWSVKNPDLLRTWECAFNIQGIDEEFTDASAILNSDYNAIGEEDILETGVYEINIASPVLFFALAKAQRSVEFSDALRIEISIDCGLSFDTIYEKTGLELSTIPDYFPANFWFPQAEEDWRWEEIDLSAYMGEYAIFRFININGFGNSSFIDNVYIDGEPLSADDNIFTDIVLFPNPAKEEVYIQFGEAIVNHIEISITNSLGQQINSLELESLLNTNPVKIDITNYTAGLYFISIKMAGQITTKLIVKE